MSEGRGFVLSNKERWNYGDSKLECVEGVYKVTYTWDGTHFNLIDNSVCHGSYGIYSNGSWKWFFPYESKDKPFWEIKNQGNGKYVCTSIQYKSPIIWQESKEDGDNRKVKKLEGGKDHPRGHSGDEWELGGSIPSELALFAYMFSRSQVLMEQLIERRKRNYKRCNAFTPSANVKPLLCINCVIGDVCVVCSDNHGGYEGRFCKKCQPRRNFCAKCGDSLGQGPKTQGFLCDKHGFGNLGENCCRMIF